MITANVPTKMEIPTALPQQKILDSGDRTAYSTGAVRDRKSGKGRFDLVPLEAAYRMTDHDEVFYHIECFRKDGNPDSLAFAIKDFCDNLHSGFNNVWECLLQVAIHFEKGAEKYGENNWQKGIPISSYIDSALRHYCKYHAGWSDEPHDRAFVWNLMCAIWTISAYPNLNDYSICNGTSRSDDTSGV